MTASATNTHYIKYHHISDDPALIEKAALLANLQWGFLYMENNGGEPAG
jgi:hypothetical protein